MILRELRIWSSLDHPNVLPLLGYVMHGSYPALISKRMVNGSLMNYMKKFPDIAIVRMVKIFIIVSPLSDSLRSFHEGRRNRYRSALPSQGRRYVVFTRIWRAQVISASTQYNVLKLPVAYRTIL